MTLNYVTLTGTLPNAGGAVLQAVLSGWTPDPTDELLFPPAGPPPVTLANATVGGQPAGTFTLAGLVANDSPNLPSGTYWTITIKGIAGVPLFTAAYVLDYANGATQDISRLTSYQPPVPVTAVMPQPSGTPAAGDVPAATGTGQASAWTTLAALGAVVQVQASGDATGVKDSQAFSALMGSGVKIALGAGQFWISQPIVPPQDTWTWIDGAGDGLTIISPANGANCDVIQGAGFSSLTNTGTGGATGAGPFLQLSNLTIDGNRSNQTLTALTNASCNPATPPPNGYGLRLYGRNWKLTNVDVRNCFAYGVWTEWGTSGSTPAASGSVEARAVNVKVYENGAHGWYHRGPSDCQLANILCYENNVAGLNAGIDFWAETDNVTNGSGTSHFTPNGLQLVNCHFWGGQATWNCVLDCNASAVNCHAEGAQPGALLLRGSVKWTGGSAYYITSQNTAWGCGVQFGDAGSTTGVPTTASYAANVTFFGVITGVMADTAARAGIVWANANQSLVKALILTKTIPTGQVAAGSNGQTLPQSVINYTSGPALPPFGVVSIADTGGPDTVTYTANNGNALTGASGGTHTLATGNTITLQNVGTVPVAGAVDTLSDVSVEVSGSGLPAGVLQAHSLHYSKGAWRHDGGAGATVFTVTDTGTDALNINTSSNRVEGPNGFEWRLYADAYTTPTMKFGGATGHIGTGPPSGKSPSVAAAGGAGSSPPAPTLQSLSSDTQGQVLFGTGTGPAAGSQVTVTFGTAFSNTPVVVLCPANSATAALQPYLSTPGASSFNVAFAVAPAAGQPSGTYAVNYIVLARGS